jgi:hypothetical protein
MCPTSVLELSINDDYDDVDDDDDDDDDDDVDDNNISNNLEKYFMA